MACLLHPSPQRHVLRLRRNQFNGTTFPHYYLCPCPSPFARSFSRLTMMYRVPSMCQVWTKGWQPSRCMPLISSSSRPWPGCRAVVAAPIRQAGSWNQPEEGRGPQTHLWQAAELGKKPQAPSAYSDTSPTPRSARFHPREASTGRTLVGPLAFTHPSSQLSPSATPYSEHFFFCASTSLSVKRTHFTDKEVEAPKPVRIGPKLHS